ncbi:Ger(x)C family spore germination protein [Bacillus cereus]
MKNKRKLILIASFASICILTGCLPKMIIDDVQLIQGVIVDRIKDQIKTTVICSLKRKGHQVQTFEGSSHTVKMGRINSSLESENDFETGQLRIALATKKFVKQDITELYEYLLRDSRIGHTVYLGIIDGKVKGFFSQKSYGRDNAVISLKKMLEHNMETGIVPTDNLHANIYRYYEEGQDTFIPIVKNSDGKIKITGLALFNKEKYRGELNLQEMYIFKGLIEKHKLDSHQFKIRNGYVLVNTIRSSPSYCIRMKNGRPFFYIKVKFDARLQEVSTNINLNQKQNVKKIEKSIEKELQVESENMIKKLQNINVDPLGFGVKLKHKYRGFSLKKWRSIYQNVPIDVEYRVNITNSGIVE